MKKFDRICAVLMVIFLIAAALLNLYLPDYVRSKQYIVDINRIEYEIKSGKNADLSAHDSIIAVTPCSDDDWYDCENEYVIRNINGTLYRIEYRDTDSSVFSRLRAILNISLAVLFLLTAGLLLYLRLNIVKPFYNISSFPIELAKGNLTNPMKEQKNRYFGKFLWGLDMLRENLEKKNAREIARAKNEKTLLLSLSHDIKTPLASIKLNAKALSKGIYKDRERQIEASESINSHADEIEKYVNEMISKLSDDFVELDINMTSFYLDESINSILTYYTERLKTAGTDFKIEKHTNCMLKGDPDRLTEVLQNIMENAVKYGDGRSISVSFSDEEDCRLVTIKNSGCTLNDSEIPHIFDSFWRGSNTNGKEGSGLGLFICRKLMHGMGGDIFADVDEGYMSVTVVCCKE